MSDHAPRLVSLDALRGATVAAMVLVNNPGAWEHAYAPLRHAAWHGCTPTDLIFPFFLFIVGASLTLSRRTSLRAALLRAAALVGLGLLLAAFPSFQFASLRWPGVLQRIGLCYLGAFLLHRRLRARGLLVATVVLLGGYWALLAFVPVPDGSPPNLEPGRNLAAWVDRALMSGHLWRQTKTWDPEGALSTLPALGTTLLGVLAGERLRQRPPARRLARELVVPGVALALAGLAWSPFLPFNKSLWTSSYALLSGGLAMLALGACYAACDLRGWQAWARPCVTFGRNAIFVFVASGLLAKLLTRVRLSDGGTLQAALHARLWASWLPPEPASLAYALTHVLGFYLVARTLEQRGLFFKV